MNNKNIIIIAVIAALIIGTGGFWGGMKYGQGKSAGTNLQRTGTQGSFGQGNRTGVTSGRRAGGLGFVNGQIIAKDDKSITVKSADGGSKIIFLAASTQVTKSASGTIADLIDNVQVMVNGTTNPDGSVTASFIQIRPQTIGQGPQDAPGNPVMRNIGQ